MLLPLSTDGKEVGLSSLENFFCGDDSANDIRLSPRHVGAERLFKIVSSSATDAAAVGGFSTVSTDNDDFVAVDRHIRLVARRCSRRHNL